MQRKYGVPVIVAGDLFDRWNEPAECITFAMKMLPDNCYAVSGQHDTANHNLEDLKRSAYWTLVTSGKIENLEPGMPKEVQSKGRVLRLHGFPWGVPVKPLIQPHDLAIEIAVIHEYIWEPGYGYKDAPKEKRLKKIAGRLKGYDVVVVGDNHVPWSQEIRCN